MTNRKKTEWEKFRAFLVTRSQCDSNCKYFQVCPVANMDDECKLKTLEPNQRRHFINLLVLQGEGIKYELIQALYEYSRIIDFKDPKDLRSYIELLTKSLRAFPVKEEDSDRGPITIDVSGIELKDNPNINIPLQLDDGRIVQEDPESLLNSPKLREIIRLE